MLGLAAVPRAPGPILLGVGLVTLSCFLSAAGLILFKASADREAEERLLR